MFHHLHCTCNILERVTHISAKLSCKATSNARLAILASECNEEVINSAAGQPILKQLHSYFHIQLNQSFLNALFVQEASVHDQNDLGHHLGTRVRVLEVGQAC